MKLRYQASKRGRIKKIFMGMTTFDDWFWEEEFKQWNQYPITPYSTHCTCNSVRAFRRRLKEAPKGVEFILVSRYVGHNVYGYGKGVLDN